MRVSATSALLVAVLVAVAAATTALLVGAELVSLNGMAVHEHPLRSPRREGWALLGLPAHFNNATGHHGGGKGARNSGPSATPNPLVGTDKCDKKILILDNNNNSKRGVSCANSSFRRLPRRRFLCHRDDRHWHGRTVLCPHRRYGIIAKKKKPNGIF